MRSKNSIPIHVLLIGLGLFALYRAINLSITYDEVYTFEISQKALSTIMFDANEFNTANNHVLNSLLIKLSVGLFGHHVWSLRLPNVLSFLVYGYSVFFLSRRLSPSPISQFFITAILCGMPYVFDFFSLARGYGLAMAFQALSIAGVVAYFSQDGSSKKFLWVAFSAAFFSVWANFTWLNFYCALWGCINLIALLNSNFLDKKSLLYWVKLNIPPLVLSIVTFCFCYLPLSYLQDSNEFRWGAPDLNAALDKFLYNLSYITNDDFKETVETAVCFVLSLGLFRFFVFKKRRTAPTTQLFIFLPLLVIVIAVIENRSLGVMYMEDRKALMLFLMLGLLCVRALSGFKIKVLNPLLLGLLFLTHTYFVLPYFNTLVVREWYRDEFSKEAANFMSRFQPAERGGVGVSFGMNSSLKYYDKYEYNNQIAPKLLSDFRKDEPPMFYFLTPDDLNLLPSDYHKVWQRKSYTIWKKQSE